MKAVEMRRGRTSLSVGMIVVLLALLTGAGSASAATGWYSERDLDPYPEDTTTNSQALGINEYHQVVGRAEFHANNSTDSAFLYENGQTTELPTWVGQPGEFWEGSSTAYAINDVGQIVGTGTERVGDRTVQRAVMWQDGQINRLNGLGYHYDIPQALDINNKGQVVGSSLVEYQQPHAVLWENGSVRDLGTLGGGQSVALGINNLGQVVGWAETASGEIHAFLWEDGRMRDLGTLNLLNNGRPRSIAHDINDKGQIVGESWYADRCACTAAVRFVNGQVTELGSASRSYGGTSSTLESTEAHAINENGQIVGYRSPPFANGTYTSVYEEGRWREIRGSRRYGSYGFDHGPDINGQGLIATNGSVGLYHAHATLLTPHPAPVVSLTAPSEGATVSGTKVTLSAEATAEGETVHQVDFYVNGNLLASDSTAGGASGSEFSISWDSTSVPNGPATIEAQAIDSHSTGTSSQRTVTVQNSSDTAAPTVSLTAPANGATVSGSVVNLAAEATDDRGVSRVDFYVGSQKVGSDPTAGGTSGNEFSFSWDSTAVANGSKSVTARAYDAAGNERVSAARTVAVSNAPPDTTAPGPVVGLSATAGDAHVSLTWTNPTDADFAATRVLRSTSGPATSPSPGSGQTQVYEGAGNSYSDALLTNGTRYHYTAFTKDASGNWSAARSVSATPQAPPPQDTQAPSVVMTAPAAGANVRAQAVTLAADATDNVAVTKVEFLVDGRVVATDTTGEGDSYSATWDSTSMTDGSATITARAYDAARNAETSRGVVVDNTYPDTRITSGPAANSTTSATTASFGFENASAERGVTFVCSLDGSAYGACASPKAYSDLAAGQHVFRVKAVGAGGEADDSDPSPAERRWTVEGPDTTAPTITGSTPAPNRTGVKRGSNVTVRFSEAMNKASLDASNVALYLGGAGNAISASVTPSADGRSVVVDPSARLGKQKRYLVVLWTDTNGVRDDASPANLLTGSGSYPLSGDGQYVYFWFKTGLK